MKVYVETNPETVYSGRVKDEVKTTEIRMWFETDEEIEVLSLTDYTKQVRKEVVEEIKERLKKANLEIMSPIDLYSYTDNFLYQVEKEIKGE